MISKSRFMDFQKCQKMFWLNQNEKSETQNLRTDEGNEIGKLALSHPAFQPMTVLESADSNRSLLQKTAECIRSGCPNIAEAAFTWQNLYCQVDILHRTETGGFDVVEVKSTASEKEYYFDDMAFQYQVLRHNVKIEKIFLMLLNSAYEYQETEGFRADKFFKLIDVTEIVRQKAESAPLHPRILKTEIEMCGSRTDCPQVFPGKQCQKWDCPYQQECIASAASEKGVAPNFLQGLSFLQACSYLQTGKLPAGKKELWKIPYDTEEIQIGKIKEFLDGVKFPLYCLDFESIQSAVPRWNHQKPWEQIPFQYSIHIMEDWEHVSHKEFLDISGDDPRLAVADSILRDIPENAFVMAYNASFERSVLKRLAELTGKARLSEIGESLSDLMLPFQKRWFYKGCLHGKYSIKNVLPALFPEKESAYHALAVQNGVMAQEAYVKACKMPAGEEKETMRQQMLAYCCQDTLSMVEILQRLHGLCA